VKVGVPKETAPGERRVALIPDAVAKLTAAGLSVLIEQGAGTSAFYTDEAYTRAGATVVSNPAKLYADAQVVLKVQRPTTDEVKLMREGAVLISFLPAWSAPELVQALVSRKITAFALELLPRITRAQPMDALSSQATIAGYKAVLLAASTLGKMLPMLMTAAGTLAPSRALILGAGVAGLQAIATARRLGAIVEAFDVRPAVKEQVESLGATFVGAELLTEEAEGAGGYAKELPEEKQRRQIELLKTRAAQADFIVSTAAIPRKRAPLLLPEATVRAMKPGSVIVDLAADTGGNCELTQPNQTIIHHGVTILGPTNLAATMPAHASQMYARNLVSLLWLMIKDGRLELDWKDEIISATCLTHQGEVRVPL
jgi:NAD(P) transhydrogenase subunit alpha